MSDGCVFTDEQQAIIQAGVDARLFVVAPAGSGKTEVLRGRIAHLVSEQGVSAASELLVLSFSRAAVAEMKRRLRAADDAASYTRCQTFDSFASSLLSKWAPDGLMREGGYDDRIRSAIELLRGDQGEPALGSIKHVLVDEVQDLVGDRAELVLELLAQAACGFSLFGDPAQSIYGFQLEESRSKMTAADFAATIRLTFPQLVERRLHKNYRAQSPIAKSVLALGPLIVDAGEIPSTVYSEISTVLEAVPRASLTVAMPRLRQGRSRSVILCRYHCQALQISKTLREENVEHRVQGRATDRAIASWVAQSISDYQSLNMPRSVFVERFEALEEDGMVDEASAWRAMRRIGGGDKRAIDLERVHNRILLGDVPDELSAVPERPLLVSTIHRAKGLEFDDVYTVDPAVWMFGEGREGNVIDPLSEGRLVYVALTRARQRMIRIDSPDTFGMKRRGNPGERWVKRFQDWMTNYIEVRGDDAVSLAPAGADTGSSSELQAYIACSVKPGDSLMLCRRDATRSVSGAYDLVHQGVVVGATSEAFDRDLRAIIRSAGHHSNPELPSMIDELSVDSVDSVAGDIALGRRCGMGRAGVWLRVRPVGLGHVVWKG